MVTLDKSSIDKNTVLNAMTGRYADFYGQFTELKKDGGELRGACPLHQGNGPNFTIDADTGVWFCHSQCGEGGDIFEFLQRKDGLRFGDALLRLAEWTGTTALSTPTRPSPRAKPLTAPIFLDPALAEQAHARLMATPKMLHWLLEHRGWTEGTIRQFGLGLAKDEAEGVYRVTFPVHDSEGRLTNLRRHLFAYKPDLTEDRRRALGKSKPWQSGLQADLFPLSVLQNAEQVLLVAGEPDAVLANQLGFAAITGTLGENNWKLEWAAALRSKCVTVLYDNDAAGEKGAQKAAAALHKAKVCVSVARYPKGIKDLTEWFLAGAGMEDVRRIIAEAVPIASPTVDTALIAQAVPLKEWPTLPEDALYGLAGDIVRAIDPHTEADPAALLVQFLVAFGSCIGRTAHFSAEADKHSGNLFAVLVGVSSKGRKGSSWGHVRRLFEDTEPVWATSRVLSGLSSGEGLIHAVRDPLERQEKNKNTKELETVTVDAGVDDKRLLVMESEFASVLRQSQRDGNTLSATLRNAWDMGRLQSMTKSSPAQATGAHISIIGHITRDELRKDLAETETANGFGNRFLWVCVKRSKELPDGGNIDSVDFAPLLSRLRTSLTHAQKTGKLQRDQTAREIWHTVYHDLSTGKPGLLGAMTGRSEAQVMRLALLYALLDCDIAIRADHLTAALTLWDYCESSARYIFGDSLGDRVADDILRALREAKEGKTRNDLRGLFGSHQSSDRIGQALALLAEHGHARVEKQATAGRTAECWFAV